MALAVGGLLGACSNDSGADNDDADNSTTAPTAVAGPAWEQIVPEGDCQCADGSEFSFWIREADPAKIVFYLDGGGACFDATTCAFTGNGASTAYEWSVAADDDPALQEGIFDLSNPDNPFTDYSFVYVPLCTGDAHLGDVTREYTPELTVQHNGFVNSTTALTYLTEHHPDADQVVVVGASPGSVAAPVYAGLASDLLPDSQITVIGDSSGAYPDDPEFNAEILGDLWGAYATMPNWDVNQGLTADDWGIPRFWVQAGLHDPEIVMARFDFAFDETQAAWVAQLSMTGADPSNLVASIDANEAAIEEAGVNLRSYTAPGTDHAVVGDNLFYTLEVNSVALAEWVDALIAGEPLDDVHCDACATD